MHTYIPGCSGYNQIGVFKKSVRCNRTAFIVSLIRPLSPWCCRISPLKSADANYANSDAKCAYFFVVAFPDSFCFRFPRSWFPFFFLLSLLCVWNLASGEWVKSAISVSFLYFFGGGLCGFFLLEEVFLVGKDNLVLCWEICVNIDASYLRVIYQSHCSGNWILVLLTLRGDYLMLAWWVSRWGWLVSQFKRSKRITKRVLTRQHKCAKLVHFSCMVKNMCICLVKVVVSSKSSLNWTEGAPNSKEVFFIKILGFGISWRYYTS